VQICLARDNPIPFYLHSGEKASENVTLRHFRSPRPLFCAQLIENAAAATTTRSLAPSNEVGVPVAKALLRRVLSPEREKSPD